MSEIANSSVTTQTSAKYSTLNPVLVRGGSGFFGLVWHHAPPCERLFLSVERDAKGEGRVKVGEEAATISTCSTGYQRPHP